MTGLHQVGARLGGHQWWEQSVWRLLGSWAASEPVAEAAILFDIHAQHAAWRAAQWWDRLPVLAVIDRNDLIRPATPALASVVAALDEWGSARSTVARAAVAYRVLLPRLVVGYRREAQLLSPVADGPAIRTLGQVVADASGDWQAGEALVQSLLSDQAGVDEAAGAVARVERLAAGDPVGEAAQ